VAKSALPSKPTVFATMKVLADEGGIWEINDPGIAEALKKSSKKINDILSFVPRGLRKHRIEPPQVIRTLGFILDAFEEAPNTPGSGAAEAKEILRGDLQGVRLSYLPPDRVYAAWLDVVDKEMTPEPSESVTGSPPASAGTSSSTVQDDSDAAVVAEAAAAVPPPDFNAVLFALQALDRKVEAVRSEAREWFKVLERDLATKVSVTELSSDVAALKNATPAEVLTPATLRDALKDVALKEDVDSLHRALAQVGKDLARRGDGAETPPVEDAGVDDWIKLVDGYVKHFRAAIKCLSPGPEQQQLETMAEGYKAQLHVVRTAAKSPPLSDDAVAMMKSTSSVSLRDQTVALVDLTNKIVRPDQEGAFEAALAKLEELTGLEPIAPKPGERVDTSVHEFEPQGVPSEHPRGTVSRMLKRGYRYAGKIFRPARVEMSKGRPEGAGA